MAIKVNEKGTLKNTVVEAPFSGIKTVSISTKSTSSAAFTEDLKVIPKFIILFGCIGIWCTGNNHNYTSVSTSNYCAFGTTSVSLTTRSYEGGSSTPATVICSINSSGIASVSEWTYYNRTTLKWKGFIFY